MAHIAGFGRDQLLLLPEAVDDYVEVDNPVRFIEAFVDGIDLAGARGDLVEGTMEDLLLSAAMDYADIHGQEARA